MSPKNLTTNKSTNQQATGGIKIPTMLIQWQWLPSLHDAKYYIPIIVYANLRSQEKNESCVYKKNGTEVKYQW